MNKIKALCQKVQAAIMVYMTDVYMRVKSPLTNNSGNEFTEKLGLIICAIVIIGIFLVAMKSMTSSNLSSISTKMEALFS